MLAAVVFGAHHLLTWLLIGLIAGALAGRVVKHGGFGIIGDIVVGLIGALVGGAILHLITGSDESSSFIIECVVAFFGAVILLLVVRAVTGRGGARQGRRRF